MFGKCAAVLDPDQRESLAADPEAAPTSTPSIRLGFGLAFHRFRELRKFERAACQHQLDGRIAGTHRFFPAAPGFLA